ncbi:putative 40S ribosomal protein S19 [Gregarina niphandrodes]|uniref:40S ribosomal protein S19 n=1 Tax=Gregarina niphandrodes TaxID=110365 RepID=A0A023BBR0_GRENI|nr:putative 40S ribosomal protein S19 [Gregarina niphandrodes]EZG79925.1 putative 40S ribosomal protein S19 [Gregarina niphandrodes]|eukprot:XP_011134370.1 putative 40S ribosomal protein S19 [Gregarina niphandrodes]
MQLLVPGNSAVFTVSDVPADQFIKKCARHLKDSGFFEIPKWAEYAKSGCSRELSAHDDDFFYIRAASILRKMAFNAKECGVGRLAHVYGGSQNRGVQPCHHRMASRKVIRYCIRQLQSMELVEAFGDKQKRRLSVKGQRCIDQIARQCANF